MYMSGLVSVLIFLGSIYDENGSFVEVETNKTVMYIYSYKVYIK